MVVDDATLQEACAQLDLADIASVSVLIHVLDDRSKALASDINVRFAFPPFSQRSAPDLSHRIRLGNAEPSIWPLLHQVWEDITSAHAAQTDDDIRRQTELRRLCYSVARFTRNLVAGVPYNQDRALSDQILASFYDTD